MSLLAEQEAESAVFYRTRKELWKDDVLEPPKMRFHVNWLVFWKETRNSILITLAVIGFVSVVSWFY